MWGMTVIVEFSFMSKLKKYKNVQAGKTQKN